MSRMTCFQSGAFLACYLKRALGGGASGMPSGSNGKSERRALRAFRQCNAQYHGEAYA